MIANADLAGKIAIVTGAAQGIGAAAACALAASGATVVLADLLEEAGRHIVTRIGAQGGTAAFQQHDVTDPLAWAGLVSHAVDRYGALHCLVNNAGIDIAATIEDARFEDFQRILNVNLYSQFHGMQAAIPAMKASGGGSIVNVSSLATRKLAPTSALYGPSKAAGASLSKAAAIFCAQQGYGIRINTVHPGPTATLMLGIDGTSTPPPAIQRAIDAIPMARMGEPTEIGEVIAFLASDRSSYMTGAELFVDGGLALI